MHNYSGISGVLATSSERTLLSTMAASTAKSSTKSFSEDIVRRALGQAIPQQQDETTAPSGQQGNGKNSANAQALQDALDSTVGYLDKNYGKNAGLAAMAIVYKRIGDGDVDETSLGDALLDVTRFIDSSFGIEEGDKFINELNGSLNKSMNTFFDNGKNEEFFAVTNGSILNDPGMPESSNTEALTLATQGANEEAAQDPIQEILNTISEMRKKQKSEESSAYSKGGVEKTNVGLLMDKTV